MREKREMRERGHEAEGVKKLRGRENKNKKL